MRLHVMWAVVVLIGIVIVAMSALLASVQT